MSRLPQSTPHPKIPALQINYLPLEAITKPQFKTVEAAYYLNRSQQTLRFWAMKGIGDITPIRVNGRLAWSVSKIKHLLGVA